MLKIQSPKYYLSKQLKKKECLMCVFLGEEFAHEPVDAEVLQLGVDQQAAVGLHHPRGYAHC